ncbi:cobalamin biosynthesis protein CobD [Ktedonosporobacter rubrisoli]|uniref:Cobalamin biosynthesis protein CobD n=1 Tax=Ktedonosporobacter rubrisoli TaxID=2509675 RepID=A0A4P6K3I1_KTERU|nr:adenosylcobinamide-phosphate synthase CbiB [Ktedonosporobacter rubrisoli]QBD82704.1 cobalamin biosynthesis protein CobD [Ktedonosporobacter rubrisoli]
MNIVKHKRSKECFADIAPLIALAVDWIGEPPAAWHPVVWYGKLIRKLKSGAPRKKKAQLLYGIAMLLLAAPLALFPAYLFQRQAASLRSWIQQRGHKRLARGVYALAVGGALKPFLALRLLVKAGSQVRSALEQDDTPAARQALRSLVSRDCSNLTPELAAAAAIESLAENLSDSVVAPLFYYMIAGLPGAAAYRLFNTFDSMIGYHGKYEYLGKAAARLDDALNLLPSRLTALLIMLCAPLFGGDRRNAWRIWRRDARKTASPNAGQPMAAAAGALNIQLEKVAHYKLGDAQKQVSAADIKRAERMVWWVGGLAFVLVACCRRWRRI